MSSTTTRTLDGAEQTAAVASTFSGDKVTIVSGRDINVIGSNVVSTAAAVLSAERDISIEAATETSSEHHLKDSKKSGLMSSGVGFSIGTRQQRARSR